MWAGRSRLGLLWGVGMRDVIIFVCVAAGWETVTHAGPFGVDVPRLVYRWTWWIAPLFVILTSTLVARSADNPIASAAAVIAAILAVATAIRFPLRRIPADSTEVSRRSVSRDPNRRKRLLSLTVPVAIAVGAAILGGL